jgi:hypothetical protein
MFVAVVGGALLGLGLTAVADDAMMKNNGMSKDSTSH